MNALLDKAFTSRKQIGSDQVLSPEINVPTHVGQHRTIFILHPSDLLTDHRPNGDGLIAFGFIRTLADRGHRLLIAVREVDIQQNLPDNVSIYELKQTFTSSPLNRIEYMIRVRSLFGRLRKTESIELLHQMNPVFAGLSLAFVGCRVPIVLGTIVPRWPDEWNGKSRLAHLRTKIINVLRSMVLYLQQRHASALLLTSPAALNKVPAHSGVVHKIFSLQHGIDSKLFRQKETVDGSHNAFSILFLANISKKKGIFVLLEAFQKVLRQVPICRLIIAGGGPEFDNVRRTLTALNLTSSVDLLGPVTRLKAVELMRDCGLYCLPSLGEPFATTLIEAMSCGKPVVATNAGGIPYLLPPNGGVLVRPDDVDGLATALLQIVTNEELRREMGNNNRKQVEKSFTWTSVVNNLEAIYKVVLEKHNK